MCASRLSLSAQGKEDGKDPVKTVAESLRMHGPETRASVLGEQRVDIFRSKASRL